MVMMTHCDVAYLSLHIWL